jgi:hypothetical protein
MSSLDCSDDHLVDSTERTVSRALKENTVLHSTVATKAESHICCREIERGTPVVVVARPLHHASRVTLCSKVDRCCHALNVCRVLEDHLSLFVQNGIP